MILNPLSFLSTPPAGHIEEVQLINTPTVNNTEIMTSLAPPYLVKGEVINVEYESMSSVVIVLFISLCIYTVD